jgi:hypothetical protein
LVIWKPCPAMEMSLFSVPSMRKLFERPRPPLAEKVARPKPKRLVETPGSVSARATGLRRAMGSSTICVSLMLPPRTGASVWSAAPASAITSMVICWPPGASSALTVEA